MAEHVKIIIKVAYDEAYPTPTVEDLKMNVNTCVQRHELLNDPAWEAVVEEWDCEVE